MSDTEYERGLASARSIQRAAWSHAVTIRVSELGEEREVARNIASGVLMLLACRRLVATAWHVVEKFAEIRATGSVPALVIGNHPILTPRQVYLDERNDLVLLEVPPEAGADLDATPYLADGRWPPKRVKVGDASAEQVEALMVRWQPGELEVRKFILPGRSL